MHRLLWLVLIVAASPLHAQTTHYADSTGDCDGLTPCHPTVTQAVAAAVDGDRIEVFPGRYTEAIAIEDGTGLTLVARAPTTGAALTCTVTATPTKVIFTERFEVLRQDRLHVEGFTFLAGAGFGPGSQLNFVRNDLGGSGLSLRMCYESVIRHNRMGSLQSAASGDCMIADNSFTGDGILFTAENNSDDTAITDNVFLSGGIEIQGERQRENRIANNRLHAGSILLGAQFQFDDNVIEGNVVDSGRLHVGTGSGARNLITGNRVFDSDGDGIHLEMLVTSGNEIIGNTSRGHAGCDIRDVELPGVDNDWSGNDYETACGGADG